jgi:hypothetical protein
VSIRKFVAAAGIAALAAGCTDTSEPFGAGPQATIDVPGNTVGTAGCVSIDSTNCFAILDNQIKILYERNNWAARRGEADYRVVTGSNRELANIFQADTRSAAEAARLLDQFISTIQTARDGGRFSECWGAHIQSYAEWIRGKVLSGNLDMSDAPQMTCFVSPVVSVSGSGNEEGGVVLTINDPWHFSGDPYDVYATSTYFVVEGPNGTITTALSQQDGATTVNVRDVLTRTPGAYNYSVVQCADWGQCSEPIRSTVTVVAGGGDPVCVHDNRDGLFTPRQPGCEPQLNRGR